MRRSRNEPSEPVSYGDRRLRLVLILAVVMCTLFVVAYFGITRYLSNAHRERINDDRQLACLLVLHDRPQPGVDSPAQEIRDKYKGCPYVALTRPAASPSAQRPAATPSAHRPVAARSAATDPARRSESRTAPRPTRTSTSKPAPTSSVPRPPQRVPVIPLCQLIGILCTTPTL